MIGVGVTSSGLVGRCSRCGGSAHQGDAVLGAGGDRRVGGEVGLEGVGVDRAAEATVPLRSTAKLSPPSARKLFTVTR